MTRPVLALLLTIGAATGGWSLTATAASPPRSVVQLGDSIASGEGTLYGYRYDAATQRWTGGNLNATWPGPYPNCHVSPDAYGGIVARNLGARFTTFACTGASYENGIVGPEYDRGVFSTGGFLRPAQFGDLAARQNLNQAYDAARPDLVLVTLGADDVRFSPIVANCIENAVAASVHLATLSCTSTNPGTDITTAQQTDLPALETHLGDLVRAIRTRGRNAGHVPKVVFTLYHSPFPARATRCPDVTLLDPAQVTYLRGIEATLNAGIRSTITGLHAQGVALADTSTAMIGPNGSDHRWCSKQPWAYGFSIFRLTDPASLTSGAPFHPTPDGQRRYAALVTPAARRLLGG